MRSEECSASGELVTSEADLTISPLADSQRYYNVASQSSPRRAKIRDLKFGRDYLMGARV